MKPMPRLLTEMAHEVVSQVLCEGMTAIDATSGNGHDTLFLANCVGSDGTVIAFDIQQTAIEQTAQRLREHSLTHVHLIHGSHDQLQQTCEQRGNQPVDAIMFNLGYLPGGDKQLTTTQQTSVNAIQQSLQVLAEAGVLTVMTYPGHPEGAVEHEAVKLFLESLDEGLWSVKMHLPMSQNPQSKGPRLFVIKRCSQVEL